MNPLEHAKALRELEASKKAINFFDEFKQFAFKGNVVDLAIGVMIGTAFGTLVKSLVEDILMPLIALVLPVDRGYEGWKWEIAGKVVPFGKFLGATVNFLLIALVLYIFLVKFLGWVLRSQKAAPPPPPTKEQLLLTEIRDLLKERTHGSS